MDAAGRFRYLALAMLRAVHVLGPLLLAAAAAAAPRTLDFTIATANLSDNTTQAYEEPGIRILRALRPDVLAIQEFNYARGGPAALVRRIFGRGGHFARETDGARLPNGIVSRWPVRTSGHWADSQVADRSFAWATLAIPGPKPLHVVSVHLLQKRSDRQLRQTQQLLRNILESFPSDDYIVLCGDFNLARRQSDVLAALAPGFDDSRQPADQEGNPNTSVARTRPYDYVLPNSALARCQIPTVLGGLAFPDGLVFDSRLWNLPPPPAEWEDSARNLQHLPVMKTFRIPLGN